MAIITERLRWKTQMKPIAQHHEGKFCQLTSLFLAEICDRFLVKMCSQAVRAEMEAKRRSNVGKRDRDKEKERYSEENAATS